jgi:hypothetical protein
MSNPNARYEIKLICPAAQHALAQMAVRLHPDGFRVAYLPRRVNNVYFDSFSAASVQDNLNGIGERAKLRWRWYGAAGIQHSQFELKRKHGSVGTKETSALPQPFDLRQATWATTFAWLHQQADERLSAWLSRISCATVINHYEREYYVSWDGQIRLTIDTRQATYDQRLTARPNLDLPAPQPDMVIIELKASVVQADRLARALNALPFHPARHSKYVVGFVATSEWLGGYS